MAVAETGVEALAISIGNAHGIYTQKPNLDFERLRQISELVDVSLVLHGGSGTPTDQIQQAVRHGITKLNIFADCRIAMYRLDRIAPSAAWLSGDPDQVLWRHWLAYGKLRSCL